MGPSCVLKVLHVLIHLILKPYVIGFINIPISQVKNGHTQTGQVTCSGSHNKRLSQEINQDSLILLC